MRDNYFLYRIGQYIALRLPLKIAYKIAVLLSDLRFCFAWQDRYLVKENLRVIFPEKSKRKIYDIRIRMFRNFAKYLVDFFWFPKIDIEFIKRNIKIENFNYFKDVLKKGKGVIVLTAHLGNWELGGIVLSLLGYPFWAVALSHKDKRVNDFFISQRQSKGIKIIPFERAVRQSFEVLKNNGILALLGDRDFSGKGVLVNFFGKPSLLPRGPAVFSLKTGASILPGFIIRNKDDTFILKFEKPIDPIYTGNEQNDLITLVEQYKVIIEDYIKRYPDQWYMFKRFWKS